MIDEEDKETEEEEGFSPSAAAKFRADYVPGLIMTPPTEDEEEPEEEAEEE